MSQPKLEVVEPVAEPALEPEPKHRHKKIEHDPYSRIKIINAKQLMEKEIIVPEFIMHPIITKLEKVVLSAEPKAGKSTMIMQIIEALINQTPFFGFNSSKPCKVLYVNAEIPEYRLYKRIELTNFKYNENLYLNVLPNFYNINEKRNIFNKKNKVYDIEVLCHEIEKIPDLDVLVLDPMINFYSGSENDSENMRMFCAMLDQVILDYNLTVILTHHERKSTEMDAQKRPFEKMRGSTVLRGWYSLGMAMTSKCDDVRTLIFDCRNTDKDIDKKFIYNNLTKRYVELTTEQGGLELIRTAMARYAQPVTAKDLEIFIRSHFTESTRKEFLATDKNIVLDRIKESVDQNMLTKIGAKLYLTEIVEQAQKDK